MKAMQFPHIRSLDLSLVEPLYALLDERHVTRAARRCDMSQSAMSRALERLRSALDDELLVRSGGAYERTPRGDQLLVDLQALLPRLDAAVRGNRFDPATAETASTSQRPITPRRFSFRPCSSILQTPRRPSESKSYPGTTGSSTKWKPAASISALIGVQPPEPFESEALFSDEFVCVVAENHPLRASRLTLRRYVEYGHAVVAIGRDGTQPWIERALAANGFPTARRLSFALSTIGDTRRLAHRHDLYDSTPSGKATGSRCPRPPPGRAS